MPRKRNAYLTIGQAAERLGLAVDTLRRLENDGLIKAERTPGAHRRFSLEAIEDFRATQQAPQKPPPVPPRPKSRPRPPAPVRSEPDESWDDWEDDFVYEPPPPRPRAREFSWSPPRVETPAAPAETPAARVDEKPEDDSKRLNAIKQHAAAWIPYDIPDRWRAKVIEDLEAYVTAERFPAWTPDWEARAIAQGRIEEVLKPFRDELAAEAARREEARNAERRVAALIDHGTDDARRETSLGWDYTPAVEARRAVEEELKARVKPDWTQRRVEKLVDQVLADWEDDDDDEDWDEEE